MKIVVNFPAPPEFMLPGAWGLIRSRSSTRRQIVDSIVCLLLALRNPYFNFSHRLKMARRLSEACREDGVLEVVTSLVDAGRCYESTYHLGDVRRVVVTEVRGSLIHGRYFHAQRVLAMIDRDLVRGRRGGGA